MPLLTDSSAPQTAPQIPRTPRPRRLRRRRLLAAWCEVLPFLVAALVLLQSVAHGGDRTLLWLIVLVVCLAVVYVPWLWPSDAEKEPQRPTARGAETEET